MHQRTYLAMTHLNTTRTELIQCDLLFLWYKKWVLHYQNIWNKVESQLFQKLIIWKEYIKKNFLGLDF